MGTRKTYAQGTGISAKRSRDEIEALLERHRAARTFTATEEGRAIVGFELADRRIQFELMLPARADFNQVHRKGHRKPTPLTPRQGDELFEQAIRERWRALVLAIKAKFVSVESGIETVEQAFLAQIVLPNKQTVYSWAKGQLDRAYSSGEMPPMLPERASPPSNGVHP